MRRNAYFWTLLGGIVGGLKTRCADSAQTIGGVSGRVQMIAAGAVPIGSVSSVRCPSGQRYSYSGIGYLRPLHSTMRWAIKTMIAIAKNSALGAAMKRSSMKMPVCTRLLREKC